MKKNEWTIAFLILFGVMTYLLFSLTNRILVSIILSFFLSIALIVGLYFEKEQKYIKAIEEYKKKIDMYVHVLKKGWKLRLQDYEEIYLLNQNILDLEQEFYCNYYPKSRDIFEDLEIFWLPEADSIEELNEKLLGYIKERKDDENSFLEEDGTDR